MAYKNLRGISLVLGLAMLTSSYSGYAAGRDQQPKAKFSSLNANDQYVPFTINNCRLTATAQDGRTLRNVTTRKMLLLR